MAVDQEQYIIEDPTDGSGSSGVGTRTYNITVDSVEGGEIYLGTSVDTQTEDELTVSSGTKVYVKCVANTGYTFRNWYVQSGSYTRITNATSASGGFVVTSASPLIITADFVTSTYNVSTVVNECGYAYVGTSLGQENYTSLIVESGTKIYVKCVSDGSSKFIQWSKDDSGNYWTSPSGSYFTMGSSDVEVYAEFESYWEDWEDDNDYRTIAFDPETEVSEGDSLLTYETITVNEGYTNSLELCVSTILGDEGLFISKSVPQNWDGDFNFVSTYNTLVKSDSYLTGYSLTGEDYQTLTITGLAAGTYYVAYRYENNGNTLTVTDRVARYKYSEEEMEDDSGWFTDDEGYRKIERGTNSGSLMLYETIVVPSGYTGEIELESSTEYASDGIILTTQKPTSTLSNTALITSLTTTSSVWPLQSTGSYATGYDGDVYNKWSKEITGITPGTYYVIGRWDSSAKDGENWVRYKFSSSGDSYTVSFNINGGSFSEGWGDTGGAGVMTKSVTVGSSALSTVNTAKKTGYAFLGWYSKPEGGEQVYDANGKCLSGTYFTTQKTWKYTGNVILYAQYSPNTYTVIYDSNCNNYQGTMNSSTFTYDTSKSLSVNNYTRDGYEFMYWTLTSEDKGVNYTDGASVINLTTGTSVILYAQWNDLNSDEEREIQLISDYNKMSVNGIKYAMENSNAEYIRDSESAEMYKIKMVEPDSVDSLDIFTVTPVMESNKNIISSMNITIKSDTNDLNLKIINRYSGYYNPIFKDILFYNDQESYPFSHTSFASTYKDNLGKFGFIKNLWYHKVNNEDNSVLGTRTLQYPLTGEYALGYRDYNIFSTNWDSGYYMKQTGLKTNESCTNIPSMKEGLCMFGSRYLNTPEYITLECFDNDDWSGEWNSEWISNTVGCPGEVMFNEINDNSVNFYFFIRKRLKRFFREMLKDEFTKYIDPEYSYGQIDTLDDDIDEYVEKNVLKLYELKKIRTFVKRTKRGVANSKIENEYGKYLDQSVDSLKGLGFIEINNVSLTKKSTDDFDRQLTYNLRNGEQEDFGFQIVIKKI